MNKSVKVSCPGSCGELFQGFIGERELLATMPIAIFNTISITLSDHNQFPDCPKIKDAFELTCDHFKLSAATRPTVRVESQQDLPISKGMSSSTADIVATIHGTARVLKQEIETASVAEICCQIEKTDSLLFPNLTVMDATTSEVFYQTDWQPDMKILVLESASTLDTVKFHQTRAVAKARKQSQAYQHLFELFQEAITEKSLVKLGRICTESSRLNQRLLPKPHFSALLSLVEEYALLGLTVAHSGTVIGFLLEKNRDFPPAFLTELTRYQTDYPKFYVTQTTMGGPRFL